MLALVGCAAENRSARRFGEYLSLAQVPEPDDPNPRDEGASISPDTELAADALAADLEVESSSAFVERPVSDPIPVVEGTVRAPWRWERLLVDAAGIGNTPRNRGKPLHGFGA